MEHPNKEKTPILNNLYIFHFNSGGYMYFEITEHHDYRESLHEITFEPVISLMQLVPWATDLKHYCVQITNKRWNMNAFALQNDLML